MVTDLQSAAWKLGKRWNRSDSEFQQALMHWCFLCYMCTKHFECKIGLNSERFVEPQWFQVNPILLATAAFHPWLISRSDWSKSPRNHQIQSCDSCGCPAIKENLRSSYSPSCRRNCRGGRELIAPEHLLSRWVPTPNSAASELVDNAII